MKLQESTKKILKQNGYIATKRALIYLLADFGKHGFCFSSNEVTKAYRKYNITQLESILNGDRSNTQLEKSQ